MDLVIEVFMGYYLGIEVNKLNKVFIDIVCVGIFFVCFLIFGGCWKKGLDGCKLLEVFFYLKVSEKWVLIGNDLFS